MFLFNFHKLVTYYSTIVMLLIGGTFVRTPNALLDLFGVLPQLADDNNKANNNSIPLEGMDPVYQLAFHLGFASHLMVGLLGLYALWHNTTTHRRIALMVFGIHQALFVWAAMKSMSIRWQAGFLLPMQVNVLLALLLFIVWEPERPQVSSLKRRRAKVKNN